MVINLLKYLTSAFGRPRTKQKKTIKPNYFTTKINLFLLLIVQVNKHKASQNTAILFVNKNGPKKRLKPRNRLELRINSIINNEDYLLHLKNDTPFLTSHILVVIDTPSLKY